MSKDFIDNEIDQAHELIKQGDFENAVNILKLIKLRIHEKELLESIKTFEVEHDAELDKRAKDIDDSDIHHYDKRDKKLQHLFTYAQSYLRFYDKLRKENDLY